MTRRSAGILLFRRGARGLEVLLVHPGGPLWARRDEGAWSIPKGELDAGEEPLAAALRELQEETGVQARGEPLALGSVTQRGGKWVSAWALQGDLDPAHLVSSRFSMEWPPKSGRLQSFPEADRAEWFTPAEARRKILPAQAPFIERLVAMDHELRRGQRLDRPDRPFTEDTMSTTRKHDPPQP